MGRVIPLKIVGSYKPDDLFFIFPCGTNPHFTYLSGDVARRGAIDRDRRTPIKWTRGLPDLIKHVLDWASYNG